MRIRLHWPNDLTTTYRNTVVEDPRPSEIECDDWNYSTVDGKLVGLNVYCNGDTNGPTYTFFEFPMYIETVNEV